MELIKNAIHYLFTTSLHLPLLPTRVLLDHLEALQSLQDLPRHIPGAHAEVGGAYAVPLAPPVDLDHRAHAHPSSEV